MQAADQSGINRNFRLSLLSQAIAFTTVFSGGAFAAEIEEVVVTAQKRAENLQEVPIAISAFSGEAMQEMGVENLTDLGKFTPGVEMHNDNPMQPTYSVRGVQTSDFTVGSDPAVAVYVDGVYNGRGAGAEVPLADIERVEILKGPQGTLFGRNATGGAIHIITKEPQTDDTTELNFTAGNYGRQSSDLIVNRQLAENLYGRFSASTNRRDAWAENLGAGFNVGDQDTQSFRGALAWEPTDDTTVVWRAEYGIMDQGSALRTSIVPSLKGDSDIFGDYSLDGETIEDRESWGTSIKVTSEFDAFTFTSITAYRGFDADFYQDEDGTANPDYQFHSANLTDQTQFSQEFRLNGATDTLKWTLGASYSQEELEHLTVADFTSGSLESFAVFEGIKAAYAGADLSTTELEELAVQQRGLMQMAGVEGLAVSTFITDLLVSSGQADGLLAMLGAPAGVTASMLDRQQLAAQLMAGIQPWVQADTPWGEDVFNTGDYRSAAVYGDFTWSLTDKMDLTVGARYTQDDKDFTIQTQYKNQLPLALTGGNIDLYAVDGEGNQIVDPATGQRILVGALPLPPLPAGTLPPQVFGLAFYNNGSPVLDSKLSDSWSDVSGRIVLDYRWTDDVMTFVSLADGFKAGGFNSLNFGPNVEPSFDQEDVVNFEVGVKSSLFDNAVRLNASVYAYQYDNLQELDLVGTPIPSYNLRNADAEGQGAEVEFQWAATDNLFIGGNYSYLDTEYTRYQHIEAIGETPEDVADRIGQARVSTPENKLNLMAEYSLPLDSGAEVVLRADYNWTDERIGDAANRDRIIEDYQLVNLRAGWNSPSNTYSAALWVQNAADEEIAGGFGGTGAAIGASPGWRFMPRMFGADMTVRF